MTVIFLLLRALLSSPELGVY